MRAKSRGDLKVQSFQCDAVASFLWICSPFVGYHPCETVSPRPPCPRSSFLYSHVPRASVSPSTSDSRAAARGQAPCGSGRHGFRVDATSP